MAVRAFSFGGGVQSTAALCLQAQGRLGEGFDLFVFAQVGRDSENPDTVIYVDDYAKPFAAAHGIELVEVQKRRRNGEPDTIRTWLDRTPKSIGIPVRMANGAPGNRSCTEQFKIRPINQELKRRGATAKTPAIVGMGITIEEWHRIRTNRDDEPFKRLAYPFIDLVFDRQDCLNVIARAGLPEPPKSSCTFCPMHRLGEWFEMKMKHPERFAECVRMERMFNRRRRELGKDSVYLSSRGVPLDQLFGDHDQLSLALNVFEGASCDIAGYCHA